MAYDSPLVVGSGSGDPEIRVDGKSKLRLLAYRGHSPENAWIQFGKAWQSGSLTDLHFSGIYGRPTLMTLKADGSLQMQSGACVTTGGVWTNASSRSAKENIRNLSAEEAMTALDDLEPVQFNYKAEPEEEHLGFIAEDVPDLVAEKDRKRLSPMDVVALLTKVVQEQQRKIADLEVRLNGQPALATG